MGNDLPLSTVRENIVYWCDRILLDTLPMKEQNRPALERLESAMKKALTKFKEESRNADQKAD
jgi:hypothetical protein